MVEPTETLTELLNTHFEWLAIYADGRTFPLRVDEMEIDESPEKIFIGLHGEKGFRIWRVHEIGREDGEVVLALSRDLGTERQTVRLIPRTPAAELAHEIQLARLLRANEISGRVETNFPAFRVVRVALNESNGPHGQHPRRIAEQGSDRRPRGCDQRPYRREPSRLRFTLA